MGVIWGMKKTFNIDDNLLREPKTGCAVKTDSEVCRHRDAAQLTSVFELSVEPSLTQRTCPGVAKGRRENAEPSNGPSRYIRMDSVPCQPCALRGVRQTG
jgi:hypothetical protein